LANLPIFVTARHVISEEGAAIHPADATIVFEGMFDDISKSVTCSMERLLVSSPSAELAYTLLLLSRWPGTVADGNIALQRPNPGDRVYVMGYPHGHGLSMSLEDTEVVAVPIAQRPAVGRDEDVVYYRAPTEKGGSGSIVFNEHWEPVALQLGGSPEFGANFGALVLPIVEDARKKLQNFQLPDELVQRLRQSMREDDGIQYQSVFISYSHADSVFCQSTVYRAPHEGNSRLAGQTRDGSRTEDTRSSQSRD
jgi:hypothetical protein